MTTLKFKIKSDERKEVSLTFLSILGMRYDTVDIQLIYNDNKSISVKRIMKLMGIKLKANDKFEVRIVAPNDEIENKVLDSLNKIIEGNNKILQIKD